LTLRELVWASEANQRAQWERASLLATCVLNTSPHRDRKSKVWMPDDLNPFADQKSRKEPEIETVEQLWSAWGVKPPESTC
jgi:hypothetical protein